MTTGLERFASINLKPKGQNRRQTQREERVSLLPLSTTTYTKPAFFCSFFLSQENSL